MATNLETTLSPCYSPVWPWSCHQLITCQVSQEGSYVHMPQEIGLKTSSPDYRPQNSNGTWFQPQPKSGTNSDYPTTHQMIQKELSWGTWWETQSSAHLVIGSMPVDSTMNSKADPCPVLTLLNKLLEALPSS